jgi:hypothetical protein
MTTNTYGDTGNRWWVGLNTAVNNKTIFGTGSPIGGGEVLNPEPSGYESLPSGNAADDAKFVAAAKYNAAHTTKPNTISVENINWYNINGSFTTQAAANAAIPAIQKVNPAPGVIGSIANSGIPGVSQIAGAVQTATSSEQALQNFIGDLTSANFWVRVAKVIAGGAILIVGLVKLTGIDQKAGGIAASAVKAAPFL